MAKVRAPVCCSTRRALARSRKDPEDKAVSCQLCDPRQPRPPPGLGLPFQKSGKLFGELLCFPQPVTHICRHLRCWPILDTKPMGLSIEKALVCS